MEESMRTHLPACTINAASRGALSDTCPRCIRDHFGTCKAIEQNLALCLSRLRAERIYAPHETIFLQGEPSDQIGIIREGTASVVMYSSDGRRQIVGFLEIGDVFGLSSNELYFATTEALSKVRACLFPRNAFISALGKHPELAPELVRIVSNERSEAAEHQLLLGQFSSRERLAAFLARQADRQSRDKTNSCELNLVATRRDIGDYLGLSMENVSRSIKDLAKRGVIELLTPKRILVKDRDALNATLTS